jgi:hypothetical protein
VKKTLLHATQRNSSVGVCCTSSTTPISLETIQNSRQLCVDDVKHNLVHLKGYRVRQTEKVYNSILGNRRTYTHIQASLYGYAIYAFRRKLPSPLSRISSKTLVPFLFALETLVATRRAEESDAYPVIRFRISLAVSVL